MLVLQEEIGEGVEWALPRALVRFHIHASQV